MTQDETNERKNLSQLKLDMLAEIRQRLDDKVLERSNAELLEKLIIRADSDDEAIKIMSLGTTYKKSGLHYEKRLEKMDNSIRYFRKNESLSFHTDDDKPTHKLIVGDNYEALQNLLIQYKRGIDVIYIDPPYGKDSMGEFAKTNYENGITRDNLLSMLYPRLMLAKQLLSDEGVIFCSIDDRNQAYVKCLFDEVFGERNFVMCFPKKGTGGKGGSTFFAKIHEYILCYARNIDQYQSRRIEKIEKFKYYDEKKGLHYNTQLLRKWGDESRRADRETMFYPIYFNQLSKEFSLYKTDDSDIEIFPMLDAENEGRWRWYPKTMENNIKLGIVELQRNKKGEYIPYERIYEDPNDNATKLYSSWIDDIDNSTGKTLFLDIMPEDTFEYPKAMDLVVKILRMATAKDDAIVLDFFAGTGTTGHAVLDMNKSYGGNRTYILCQINEIDEKNPNGIAYDTTSKRLKRIMTGECYDGSKDFPWAKDNEPYGGNLDVYEIERVPNHLTADGHTPFEAIDETLYGKEKFKTLKEKIDWVCQNFANTQKFIESDEDWEEVVRKGGRDATGS